MNTGARSGKLRAAIIGAGHIARQHAACLATLEQVELVAVCDRSQAKAECFAERFEIKRSFTDCQALFDERELDMVHITTPPESHYPLAMAALEAGAHLFVEKPMCPELPRVRELQAAAAERDLWLLEDHNYRFNAPVQRALALCGDGRLGRINHLEIGFYLGLSDAGMPAMSAPTNRFTGGVVSDFLPHLAYLALLFAGPVEQVQPHWRPPPEGSAHLCEEFRCSMQGRQASVDLVFSAATRPHRFGIRLYAEHGIVDIDLLESSFCLLPHREGSRALGTFRNGLAAARSSLASAGAGLWQRVAAAPGPYSGLWALLDTTYSNLRRSGEPPVSAAEILAAQELMHTMLEGAPAAVQTTV